MNATDAIASARIQTSISAKRRGSILSDEDIAGVVGDFVEQRVPDYQMASWLATVAARGLSLQELTSLTNSYLNGGDRLHLERLDRVVLDKHSTGGVGDKVSLVVTPIVAACGVAVVKMSGRGLGHAGGTIDKLESIPGIKLDLGKNEIHGLIETVGMTIVSQSPTLAPGDGATYALRDVTGTVESIPLIAASIISKKVAVGARGLVLDVKTGAGALIPDREGAEELARTMLELAATFGLSSAAILSDMSQPLGRAVGNSLEIAEALATLRGDAPSDLWESSSVLARLMLQSADPTLSDEDADARVSATIRSGAAYEKFVSWVSAQGGNASALEVDGGLPGAENRQVVTASRSGFVHEVDPRAVGMAGVYVGAGRLTHNSPIDHGAGVLVHARVGDFVEEGAILAELYFNRGDEQTATQCLSNAFRIGESSVESVPIVHDIFANPASIQAN